ncbi:MAG: HEAT repeat domain-containing protein [Planctomycetota bacterium]
MGKKLVVSLMLSALLLGGCKRNGAQSLPLRGSVSEPLLETQALDIVKAGLTHSDPLVRARAIEVVAFRGRTDLMYYVTARTADEYVPVRFAAALAVGDLKYARGLPVVESMLKDSNQNVQVAAAYALTRLGQKNLQHVFQSGLDSSDQTVRANTALVVGKLGEPRWIGRLYKVIESPDSQDKAVYQAAEAIAMLGDEKIYPKLWTMLISAYADVRVMGIKAMGALGTAQAQNAIITLLDDEIPEVRLVAAGQLGQLGENTGETVVLEFFAEGQKNLDTPDLERAKVLTAIAIGQIGTDRLERHLPALLEDESIIVRLAAAKAVLMPAK